MIKSWLCLVAVFFMFLCPVYAVESVDKFTDQGVPRTQPVTAGNVIYHFSREGKEILVTYIGFVNNKIKLKYETEGIEPFGLDGTQERYLSVDKNRQAIFTIPAVSLGTFSNKEESENFSSISDGLIREEAKDLFIRVVDKEHRVEVAVIPRKI